MAHAQVSPADENVVVVVVEEASNDDSFAMRKACEFTENVMSC